MNARHSLRVVRSVISPPPAETPARAVSPMAGDGIVIIGEVLLILPHSETACPSRRRPCIGRRACPCGFCVHIPGSGAALAHAPRRGRFAAIYLDAPRAGLSSYHHLRRYTYECRAHSLAQPLNLNFRQWLLESNNSWKRPGNWRYAILATPTTRKFLAAIFATRSKHSFLPIGPQ